MRRQLGGTLVLPMSLVELVVTNTTEAIVRGFHELTGGNAHVTVNGHRAVRVRARPGGVRGVLLRGRVVTAAPRDVLLLKHLGDRRMLETPLLPSESWLHAILAVVPPVTPLVEWWNDDLLPLFQILVANWPHQALAIVPATIISGGVVLDSTVALPSSMKWESLVASAIAHLVDDQAPAREYILHPALLTGGAQPVHLSELEHDVLLKLAEARLKSEAYVPYRALRPKAEADDTVRTRIHRLQAKLEEFGVDDLLDKKKGHGARILRSIRCVP